MSIVAMLGMAQDELFLVVEKNPEFPGGMSELMNFLSTNIKYPADCEEAGIQGRVIVTFVVEKDGSVSEPTVIKSVHKSMDEEAVRVISMMPKWVPGEQRGKQVRVKFTLPIIFRMPAADNANPPVQHIYDLMKENEGLKQNPDGLYRLMMMTYKNGKQPVIPSLEQYKYVGSKGAVIMAVTNNMEHTMLVRVRDDVGHPLPYTGDTPQGADGKDTRVFDSGPTGFKFAWYSHDQTNKNWFPDNEFVYEWYSNKEGMDRVKKSVNVMKNWNVRNKENPLLGCWHSEGKVKKIGDKEMLVERNEPLYCIYDEDASISLIMEYGSSKRFDYILREAHYGKDTIIDGDGREFLITWESKDKNAMRMTWEENGVQVSEIYVRCNELPEVVKIICQ